MKPLTEFASQNLKVGDVLVVVDNYASDLKHLEQVIFQGYHKWMPQLLNVGKKNCFFYNRFSLMQKTVTQPRDSKGRFAAKAQPKTRTAPVVLRNGSLYAVKRKRGYQTARLRSRSFGDLLVFSAHSKPFLARKGQVRLADNAEVQAYLNSNK